MKTFFKIFTVITILTFVYMWYDTASIEENKVEITYNSPIEKALKTFIVNVEEENPCKIIIEKPSGEVITFKRNKWDDMYYRDELGPKSQSFYYIDYNTKGYVNDVRVNDKIYLGQAEPTFELFNEDVLGGVLDIVILMSELPEEKIYLSDDGKYYMIQIPVEDRLLVAAVSLDGTTYYQSDNGTEMVVQFGENFTIELP